MIVFRQNKILKTTYEIIRFTLGNLIKLIWVKKVTGLDLVPNRGAFIIAANHESYFDFLSIISVSKRQIHFLAGEVFFKNLLWLPLMLLTSQIKVDRNSKDKSSSLKVVGSALDQGKVIGIFPEGTRSPDGKLLRARPGVAKIAIEKNVPIVPVGVKFTSKVMSKSDKFPRFRKVIEINFGEPIYPSLVSGKIYSAEDFQSEADSVMKKIAILAGKTYPYA